MIAFAASIDVANEAVERGAMAEEAVLRYPCEAVPDCVTLNEESALNRIVPTTLVASEAPLAPKETALP